MGSLRKDEGSDIPWEEKVEEEGERERERERYVGTSDESRQDCSIEECTLIVRCYRIKA